jgi:uncharacterized membrane protein HdeD (DUF308 family)
MPCGDAGNSREHDPRKVRTVSGTDRRKGDSMEATDLETQEAIGMVSKLWWMWLVTGILWVCISLVILQFRGSSITTVGIIIGLMFLLMGFQDFALMFMAEGWKWLWGIFGFVFVVAGIVAMASPKNTVTAFADVLGFLFLLVAVFWIVEAFATKETNPLWWLGLISGILMLGIAFWTGSQLLVTKVYTLLVFAGVWAMLHGITDMVKAFQVKKVGKIVAG